MRSPACRSGSAAAAVCVRVAASLTVGVDFTLNRADVTRRSPWSAGRSAIIGARPVSAEVTRASDCASPFSAGAASSDWMSGSGSAVLVASAPLLGADVEDGEPEDLMNRVSAPIEVDSPRCWDPPGAADAFDALAFGNDGVWSR